MQSEIEKVEEQGGLLIEGAWHEIQQVLKDYMTDTAPNRPHYNSLQAKDKTNTEQLLYHCDLVNKYTVSQVKLLKPIRLNIYCYMIEEKNQILSNINTTSYQSHF